MNLLFTPHTVLLLALLFLAACSDKPDYPASDAAVSDATISDAATDVADTTVDAAVDAAADATVEDTTPDTEQDSGPCNGGCSTDAYCDTTTDSCVACLDDTHCPGGLCADDNTCVECFEDNDCAGETFAFACDTENNECVECVTDDHCDEGVCADDNKCVDCLSDDDCTDPTAAACDTTSNTCVACTEDAACSNVGETNLCDTSGGDGVCVKCTVEEETPCNGEACDPATNTCTGNLIGQTGACEPCKADSECIADHKCVEMEFKGTALDDGYCLQEKPTSGCPDPYKVNIERATLSGLPLATYCGVNESLTTCTAVLDHGQACSSDDMCGIGQRDDGKCFPVYDLCTYPCDGDGQCHAACVGSNLCSVD